MSSDNNTPRRDTPDREERVVELLHAAARSERAPGSLHAQVAAMRQRATASRRGTAFGRPALRRPAFNFARVALPTATAGVVALVVALGSGPGAPSIAQAASIGTRAPTAPAPGADPAAPTRLLTAKVGTLHFPNWQAVAGWRTVGQRQDKAGNRTVTTVYYAAGKTRIAYSIVSSPALPGSKHAGELYSSMWHNGRATVVWQQDGHTCLLSGSGISPVQLWQLASIR